MSKTVAKALLILKQFKPGVDDLGASEIGRMLDMDKVIAHRLLKTLAAEEFVVQDPVTRRFRLGPGLISLASHNLREAPIAEVGLPWMLKLRDLCDETLMISVRRGTEVVVVSALESRQAMRVTAAVGDAESLHCTASGKLMLAWGPQALFDQLLLGGLPTLTERTIRTPEKLRGEVARAKAQGWALDDEENVMGIRAIAAPIFSRLGEVQACLIVRGPKSRMGDEVLQRIVPELCAAAKAISESFGYNPAT